MTRAYLPLIALTASLILLAQPPFILANSITTVNDTIPLNATTSTDSGVRLTAMFDPATTTVNAVVFPEVLLTLTVIGGCALLGLGIAKVGDYCYDRHMATRDDISNASEYTKNILRTRLAVMKMKSDPETDDGKVVKAAASAWIETVTKDKPDKANSSTDLSGDAENATENDVEKCANTSVMDNTESADGVKEAVTVTVAPVAAPLSSPLPNNKITPVTSRDKSDTSSNARANALPPIQRPKTPVRAINQPIRSTR